MDLPFFQGRILMRALFIAETKSEHFLAQSHFFFAGTLFINLWTSLEKNNALHSGGQRSPWPPEISHGSGIVKRITSSNK